MPLHRCFEKNWDLWNIYQIMQEKHKNSFVYEFGCRESFSLSLLHCMDFKNVYGTDLYNIDSWYNFRTWLSDYILLIGRKIKYDSVYHLTKCDGVQNPDAFCDMFDVGISVSAIEHNVDLNRFFKEMSRIIRDGGLLYVSTDYWENKITTDKGWSIFSKQEVLNMIETAAGYGFSLFGSHHIPDCDKGVVMFNNECYSFLSMEFKLEKKSK